MLAAAHQISGFATQPSGAFHLPRRDPNDFMWGEALDALARAERLHRQLFQPATAPARQARWEPPVDVLETDSHLFIVAALPGVSEGAVQLAIDSGALVIAGQRAALGDLRAAVVHRMELPQGRFERRVPLPAGRYDQIERRSRDGCLIVSLRKVGG